MADGAESEDDHEAALEAGSASEVSVESEVAEEAERSVDVVPESDADVNTEAKSETEADTESSDADGDDDDEIEVFIPDAAEPAPTFSSPPAPAKRDDGDVEHESDSDDADEEEVEGGGLELVAQERARAGVPENIEKLLEELRKRQKLDDFSGAYELASRVLKIEAGHPEAQKALAEAEEALANMYRAKLGSLKQVPKVAVKADEMMWLDLDHRSGFLLSQIDGAVFIRRVG